MQTYRVKMTNVKTKSNYEQDAPKGAFFFHLCSDSITGAVQLAEQQFTGECESVSAKRLTEPYFKFRDMQEYENYEMMSSPSNPSDTIIFRKNYQKVNVTLRGGHFSECGFSFWFDLSILNLFNAENGKDGLIALNLSDLERMSLEIYSVVQEKQIPTIFKGKMNRN